MELKERGVADFGVSFGDSGCLPEIVKKIARREGIYAELANGSKWLAEKYGAKDAAIHAKGLELASYEPRKSVGMGLGYATSNRGGCHLNGGYLALLESVGVLSADPVSYTHLDVYKRQIITWTKGLLRFADIIWTSCLLAAVLQIPCPLR